MKNERLLMLSVAMIGAGVVAMVVLAIFTARLLSAGIESTSYINELTHRVYKIRESGHEPAGEMKKIEAVLVRLKDMGMELNAKGYYEEVRRKLAELERMWQNPEEYGKTVSSIAEDLADINTQMKKDFSERLTRLKGYGIAVIVVFFGIPLGASLVVLLARNNKGHDTPGNDNMDVCAESMPLPVIKIDRNGWLLYANSEFAEWSGYGREESRGRRLDSLVEKEEHQRVADILEELSNGKTIRGVQVRVVKKEGLSLVELDGAPIRDDTGESVIVLKDVESIKKVMSELEKARKRAEEAKEKLKKMVSELEEFALIAIRREMKLKEIKERILTEDKKQ